MSVSGASMTTQATSPSGHESTQARRFMFFLLREAGIGVALLLLILFFSIFANHFASLANLSNILTQISINTVIAVGMTFVILLGGIVFTTLKLDLLPKIEPPVVNILTTWPGASASDVEQRVTKTIEDDMSMIEGVDKIFSRSMDNVSVVTVQFKWGEDLDVKMGDIRDSISFVKRDLPADAPNRDAGAWRTIAAPTLVLGNHTDPIHPYDLSLIHISEPTRPY